MTTYKTRRDCNNCWHSTEYEIPWGVAFESYKLGSNSDNLLSGYKINGKKTELVCENCGLARLI